MDKQLLKAINNRDFEHSIEDDFEKYALEKRYKPGNTTTIIGMYKPIAPDNWNIDSDKIATKNKIPKMDSRGPISLATFNFRSQ